MFVGQDLKMRKEREARLQGVEPSSIQEDGKADKVAVFCYNI